MAMWSGVLSKLRGVMVAGAILAAVAAGTSVLPFLSEETAKADTETEEVLQAPSREVAVTETLEERNARWDRMEAEAAQRSGELEKRLANRPKRRTRRVERYTWEAPADTRARLWNIPETEAVEAVTIGLLRICTSEQAGSENDCIGIWQVLQNIRSRSCNRGLFRRITECDDNGETILSVMRRASRFALGVVPPRNKRQVWISELDLSCAKPESYPHGDAVWERSLLQRCHRIAELTEKLVGGEKRIITRARVIAWGGRCENSQGACDDRHACARGLARVPGLKTKNAFWCQPGSTGCAPTVDPICTKLGYAAPRNFHPVISNTLEKSDENS